MTKRTIHSEERHAAAGRPSSEAETDRKAAHEIYRDTESGCYIFIGPRGRTHVFIAEG